MDFEHRNFYYQAGIESFFEFLESGTYEMELEDRGPRAPESWSLFDALQMWLYFGDGLDVCPTFESFLVAAIVIIDNWLANDRVRVGNAHGHNRLWPFGDEEMRVPLLGREDERFGITEDEPSHQMLNRAVYDQLKSWKEAQDRRHQMYLLRHLSNNSGGKSPAN